MATKVFVGNLSFQTPKDTLTQLLSEAGQIVDIHLPPDRVTGRPRGFAFVTFTSETEAAEAIRRFHDHEVDGRKLVVNPADSRPPRAADGGGAFRLPAGRFGTDRPPRAAKRKGSRRGLRGRKRSL